MEYSEYQHLVIERNDDGILLITINRPEVLNATNKRLHWELSRVWLDIADDPETRVVVGTSRSSKTPPRAEAGGSKSGRPLPRRSRSRCTTTRSTSGADM